MTHGAEQATSMCHPELLTCAECILVLVQESGAAVGDGSSIVLHNKIVSRLLWVKLEAAIAMQVLPQLCAKCAVCSLQAKTAG